MRNDAFIRTMKSLSGAGAASALVLLAAAPAAAQSEAAIREYFEGRMVMVKLDMPGTQLGVDVTPGPGRTIDFPAYAQRLKDFGAAVPAGTMIMVTKVRVKDKLIEVQLGGGGFGTFWDDSSTSVYTPTASKTKREKDLEDELKRTPQGYYRQRLEQELDALRQERRREDARNQSAALDAQEEKKANLRQQRKESGSRFNIRVPNGVPSTAITPEGVMAALDAYVTFSDGPGIGQPAPSMAPATAPANVVRANLTSPVGQTQTTAPSVNAGSLRKGMAYEDVVAMFGKPERTGERSEGSIKIAVAVFGTPDSRIEAEFIQGLLIKYSMSSK
jgi:hypothetical protein